MSKIARPFETDSKFIRFRFRIAEKALPTSHERQPGAKSVAPSVSATKAGFSGSSSITASTTGISGDDDNEATLHLIEHVSEDNERYFKMRVENGTSWSVSNFWRQLVPPEEYDLSPDEWDSILNMLFYRDVWDDSNESFSRWKLSGQEFHTVGGIIIEEIEGAYSDAGMGTSL